jgi:hypothetical protein
MTMSTRNSTPATPTPTPPVRRSSKGGFAGRYTGTVIMVGVFLLLAVALFALTNNPNAGVISPTPTAAPPPTVWNLSAGTTQGLVVQSPTGTVALQIVNNQWQLTAPTNEPASQFQVGAAADQLKNLQATQVITAPADLAQYGLNSPVLTVTLVISGVTPPENRLLVGSSTIEGGSYYVQVAGQPYVYVVLNTLIEQLRSWLTTPPKAEPTPTPLVVASPVPTSPITGTVSLTPIGPPAAGTTPGAGATEQPTAGAASPAADATATTGSTPAAATAAPAATPSP